MESSLQAIESLIAVESEIDNVMNDATPTNDQYFLLHFIMGTYFGPRLKEEPHKSILQRHAEGLPPYTLDQLAGSHIRTVEIERIYCYILRKADRSVVVERPWLQQFLHGNLPSSVDNPAAVYPQFDALFPPRLHPHSWSRDQYDVFHNIVFINDPEIYYVSPDDVEKFKRLTQLERLYLDRQSALTYTLVDGEALYDMPVQVESKARNLQKSMQPAKGALESGSPLDCDLSFTGTLTVSNSLYNAAPPTCTSPAPQLTSSMPMECTGNSVLLFPARPSKEEWSNIVATTKSGVGLTGSAATGNVGPVVGLVDIGECDDSFLFRVSLPGVKRDEKEFNCEVESDGKVSIRGVTTGGERTVYMYSQVFEMQSQNLCPPGPFYISFKLPGPVDPLHFSGNFGTDGILEGLVMKAGHEGQ